MGKRPRTLELAGHVIVSPPFPSRPLPPRRFPEWYRARWQVELVLKRFKSLGRLGQGSKRDAEKRQGVAPRQAPAGAAGREAAHPRGGRSPWGCRLEKAPTSSPRRGFGFMLDQLARVVEPPPAGVGGQAVERHLEVPGRADAQATAPGSRGISHDAKANRLTLVDCPPPSATRQRPQSPSRQLLGQPRCGDASVRSTLPRGDARPLREKEP